MKQCSTCKVAQPLTAFSERKDSVDGYARQCKTCRNQKIKAWQKENKGKVKAAKRRYYATPKGKQQKQRSDIAFVVSGKRAEIEARRAQKPVSEARKAARTRWAKANQTYSHAQTLYRRSLVRGLQDFDLFVLQEAVLLARKRESMLGSKWHVDHIIPVSKGGSSQHDNIQVVPAVWNRRKSNKHANMFFGA
jgi:5-methylcytosine-specific restriction endonuclease McrA